MNDLDRLVGRYERLMAKIKDQPLEYALFLSGIFGGVAALSVSAEDAQKKFERAVADAHEELNERFGKGS